MKKFYILFLALLCTASAYSQYKNVYKAQLQWSATWDFYLHQDDVLYGSHSMTIDDSNFIYFTGGTVWDSFGNLAWFIGKYNPDGSQKWMFVDTFGTNQYQYNSLGRAIAWDSAHHLLYSAGYRSDQLRGIGQVQYYFVKITQTDKDRNRIYDNTPDLASYASGMDVYTARNGSMYSTGYAFRAAWHHDGIVSLRADKAFGAAARFEYDSAIETMGQKITGDDARNAYVAGIQTKDNSTNLLCVKYDSTGKMLWSSAYKNDDSTENTAATAIAANKTGNVYITGNIPDQSTGTINGVILKYNWKGTLKWVKRLSNTVPGTRNAACNAMLVDKKGYIYAGGYAETNTGTYAVLEKLDSLGNTVWTDTLQDPYQNRNITELIDMAADDTGNVYVTGIQSDNINFRHIYVARYSSDGARQWYAKNSDSAGGYNVPLAIRLDKKGDVVVAGSHDGDTITGKDVLLLKFHQTMSRVKLDIAPYNSPEALLTLYPNPASDHINIELHSHRNAAMNFYLYDMTGRIVAGDKFENAGSDIKTLATGNLRPGLYFYRATVKTAEDSEVLTGKIEKQ